MYQSVSTPVKLLEDFLLLVLRDANPAILDLQIYAAVRTVQTHADVFPVLGVLQGVVQEVEKRTRDRFAVHDYRWNVAGNVLLEGKSILLDLKAVGLQSRMNQFGEVGFLELVFLASRLNSGEVQDVVNECRQALALLSYDAEVLLIFVLGHKPPELQGLGIQPDQGQGRPQFM